MSARRVARVLIDSPLPQLDRLFDYAVPAGLLQQAQPGVRVRVPLRTAGRVELMRLELRGLVPVHDDEPVLARALELWRERRRQRATAPAS